MGRVSEAIKQGPPRVGHWCDICTWLDSLDDDDRGAFAAVMDDDEAWNNEAVKVMLADFGVRVMSRDVYNHRRASL